MIMSGDKKLSVKRYSVIALLATSMVISFSFASNNSRDRSVEADSAMSSVVTFVMKDIKTKYTLMSDRYRSIFRDTKHLEAIFNKESYEIYKVEEKKVYTGKRTGERLAYIRLKLKWQFEGYDGIQTCHFKLVKSNKLWRSDWILC